MNQHNKNLKTMNNMNENEHNTYTNSQKSHNNAIDQDQDQDQDQRLPLVDERTRVKFDNISLDVVSFNRTYLRNRGTLSQIVKSLIDMSERLSKPTNEYQQGLYPHIQKECKITVDVYNNMLQEVDHADYNVFGFYLNGPRNDGKRKATTTVHEMKSYAMSEFKETHKSINDRLRHIKLDCQRKMHDNTRNNHDVFARMIVFCDAYHIVIDNGIKTWDEFIEEFRHSNGMKKTEKSNQRTNKRN